MSAATQRPVGMTVAEFLLRKPVLVIEVLSPSNSAETWQNVWSYMTFRSVREVIVIYMAEVRIDLFRREPGGALPDDPLPLRSGDIVTLDSIDLTVPVVAFYRTA